MQRMPSLSQASLLFVPDSLGPVNRFGPFVGHKSILHGGAVDDKPHH